MIQKYSNVFIGIGKLNGAVKGTTPYQASPGQVAYAL